MKIKKEHYEYMEEKIKEVIDKFPGLYDEYKKHGLSDKRYCFDLTYMAKLSAWLCTNVYPYANDDHIYTALKQITGKGK